MQIEGAISHIPTTRRLLDINFPVLRARELIETGQTCPFITCRWARHSMPTCLNRKRGARSTSSPERKLRHSRIHCTDHFSFIRTFRLQSGGGPYIAQRVSSATHSLGELDSRIWGRGPKLALGQESAPCKRAQRILEKRACSEGRGSALSAARCNADRKANRKGAVLVNGASSWRQ